MSSYVWRVSTPFHRHLLHSLLRVRAQLALGHQFQEDLQANRTTGHCQDESRVWDLAELDFGPQDPQPKGKKRKSKSQGGRAATATDVDENSGEDAEQIESEQLRTPHGQRMSNISFTRTNTVQKMFASAANRNTPAMSGACLRPAQLVLLVTINPSTQQANTRQQMQRIAASTGPNGINYSARNGRGNNNSASAGNGDRAQSKNGRGHGRGRVVHPGQNNSNRGNHRQNANTSYGSHQRRYVPWQWIVHRIYLPVDLPRALDV